MLGFLCKNIVRLSSKTELGFLQNTIVFRSLSIPPLKQDDRLVKASEFLTNSCGLSPEYAKSVSGRISLKKFDNANAVVRLLRDHGLTNIEISKMVVAWPQVLLCRPNKTLVPKLEFLQSVGASRSDICMILYSNPTLLASGLETLIVPLYNTLRSVLVCNVKVFTSMRRLPRVGQTFFRCLDDRLHYLRELGMRPHHISSLVLNFPLVLGIPSHKFNPVVKKVIEIGCDPTKPTFGTAIKVMADISGRTRKAKLEVYRKYGLSENEIWSIFKENPLVLKPSVAKITEAMDFLVSKMGLHPAYIARNAVIFSYSFHNRIVPRCSVIRILRLKGLMEQDVSLISVAVFSEKKFMDLFVTKYPKEAPQLLNILQRRRSIQDLGLDFEEKAGACNL